MNPKIELLYESFIRYKKVSTDTRNNLSDSIFFALKGLHYDANLFVQDALDKGAEIVVSSNEEFANHPKVFFSPDTLQTLQDLALYHRNQLKCKVIGITGSNGKTTTKELVNRVLSEKYKTCFTQGNLNNHIGVPLTLLATPNDCEILVLEMGANHVGEIKELSNIGRPTHGIITNVGKAHIGEFSSFEKILETKMELFHFLETNGGTIFSDSKNELIHKEMDGFVKANIIEFGQEDSAFAVKIVDRNPYLTIEWTKENEKHICKTRLFGDYNLQNICFAIQVGLSFEIGASSINSAIESFCPNNNRSQILETQNNTLFCDYYNANPTSMSAAIDNFANVSGENKVLIIGTMSELGDESEKEHLAIIEQVKKYSFDAVYLVGKEFGGQEANKNFSFFESVESLYEQLKIKPLKEKKILLKASRSVRLERIVELL